MADFSESEIVTISKSYDNFHVYYWSRSINYIAVLQCALLAINISDCFPAADEMSRILEWCHVVFRILWYQPSPLFSLTISTWKRFTRLVIRKINYKYWMKQFIKVAYLNEVPKTTCVWGGVFLMYSVWYNLIAVLKMTRRQQVTQIWANKCKRMWSIKKQNRNPGLIIIFTSAA